ncbi:hypothetical protein NBRC10512_003014 [Rhodotorula toruloides]|uniref:RHTO0S14e03356g1_1 n=2 Tax=Rhodotorula toruloides TaxID=5286 RepID=A0A061BBU2_RHOTO|nr:sucrase/ferredoxin-like family protein [Rhodotorula toruloides NP11]EMS24853.1 sucrase/ferredoxin-like family protein [Rhodotorula toruloides NP11]CDR47411.1 RHTO0S14e03356g1_1 [Rhodotorula toruloides]
MAGIPDRPAPPAALVDALRTVGVPLESLADACKACDACDDEADLEDLAYPKGFDVDLDSQMLGELKPLGRQILVSSGKSDWIREVTDDTDSIPGLVKLAYDEATAKPSAGLLGKVGGKLFKSGKGEEAEEKGGLPGVHPSKAVAGADVAVSSRLSILSSSFISNSHTHHHESVIVLPDYKVVHDVEPTRTAVDELVERYLRPEAGRVGLDASQSALRSWPLPYQAVILLCSHRKRDKRCSIAAPLLISQFHTHLDKHGLHVDERGEDLAEGPAIEEWEGDEGEKRRNMEESLRERSVEGGRVGLFKVSHIGGHRYAGNVIIYFPNGSSIWYGRATPADVAAIVDRTIMQGKVIPELLRGGLGLAGKTGPRGVLEW